ncbi:MAG: DNA repair protein RadC [Mariprofundales bacterium]
MADDASGHRSRLRQRFAKHGFTGFHDYEVLELWLTYAIARRDVKPLAKRLLAQFQTLAAVYDASPQALQSVQGIGEQTAIYLSMVRHMNERYLASSLPNKEVFNQPRIVRAHLRLLLQARTIECFGCIFADQQHRHISSEILFEGTVDKTQVYPRILFKRALELDAKAMILFHNHPGGTPQPSKQDKVITQRIQEASVIMEVRLLDHLIVADTQIISFAEQGLL